MSLTIPEMPHSPYCIPITRALEAFAIPFDRVHVSNWDRREIMELTDGAYYQVPVLAHDEALIYETSDRSLDVARYVDKHFGSGQLFPSTTAGIDEVLIEHIENDVEGLSFRLCDVHYTKRHHRFLFVEIQWLGLLVTAECLGSILVRA